MLDTWISYLDDAVVLKLSVVYTSSYTLTVVVWHATRFKRKQIVNLMQKVKEISSSPSEKVMNYLVLIICSLPVICSIIVVTVNGRYEKSNYYLYGYDLGNGFAKYFFMNAKAIIHHMIHPTYTNIVALFYISLCLRCTACIKYLNRKATACSLELFAPTFQHNILRKRAKIHDFLLKLQDIFSLPIFFILVANIMTWSSITGWFLVKRWNETAFLWKVESMYCGISSVLCVVSILWVAGSVRVALNTFKETFHQKTHQRLLYFNTWEELFLKIDLYNEPDFVFSGCNIVSFRRSSILALIGTLFTYTMLIMSVN
ncbi:uncharacterized protein NPIL_82391 [Nephila pilipes]|uniref:Gustatory receptor n=1 Tax=Nephila pilipes TaxID=299642 RepID=A0A8X6UL93_NEPPI|nr:uncharacterized protein NPIL_82391 [Nephila pilipes]